MNGEQNPAAHLVHQCLDARIPMVVFERMILEDIEGESYQQKLVRTHRVHESNFFGRSPCIETAINVCASPI